MKYGSILGLTDLTTVLCIVWENVYVYQRLEYFLFVVVRGRFSIFFFNENECNYRVWSCLCGCPLLFVRAYMYAHFIYYAVCWLVKLFDKIL
jgi:hypothetical protein